MVITSELATKVAHMDATVASTDPRYAKKNAYQYQVLIDTWRCLADDISPNHHIGDILLDSIVGQGLIPTIKTCNDDADCLIHDHPFDMSPLGKAICSDMSMAHSLQVLRFAKRFSPYYADVATRNSLINFISVNNSVKMRDRRGYYNYFTSEVKDIVASIVGTAPTVTQCFDQGYFSSGAVSNCENSLAAKVAAWSYPDFLGMPYTKAIYPRPWQVAEYEHDVYGNLVANEKTAKAQAVPKSYKAARIIAMEDSTRQWVEQGIRYWLEERIGSSPYAKHMPLGNQEVNQRYCFSGAIGSTQYSTIDLSHASDSLSWALVQELFPKDWVLLFREFRSSTMLVDGKVIPCYMAFTSGSALCFVVETIAFFALALSATNRAQAEHVPYVYGDDIIIDNNAYETCFDVLRLFGFSPNPEKSFTTPSLYRESCGVEFYGYEETTTVYWPRKAISKGVASYESLVDLHNRLYKISWLAHTILIAAIREIAGDHFTMSDVSDLVEGFPCDPVSPYKDQKMVLERSYSDRAENPHYTEASCTVVQRCIGHRQHVDDVFYYTEYLRKGPQYDDALSRLLGVSTSRISSNDGYSRREPVFALIPHI